MATLSQYLIVVGALLLLFAFVTRVAYTTILAMGRRSVAAAASPSAQLAATTPGGVATTVTGAPTPELSATRHGQSSKCDDLPPGR